MAPQRGSMVLIWLLLGLLLVMYVRYNTKKVMAYEVLQVTPANLTFEVLSERKPVVLRKGNKPIEEIIEKALRYTLLYTSRRELIPTADFREVQGRYEIIVAKSPIEVEIIHPGYVGIGDYQSISLKLDINSIAILPTYWAYKLVQQSPDKNAHDLIVAHDIFSTLRGVMFVNQ